MEDEAGRPYVPRKEISRIYHHDTELEPIKKKSKRRKGEDSSSEEEEAAFLHDESGKDRNYHATDADVEKGEKRAIMKSSAPMPAHSLIEHAHLTSR